jgi:predicted amidohydrolase YtcJ
MAGSLLFRNGVVLDVENGRYDEADVRVVDGRIVDVGTGLTAEDGPTIDLRGAHILPGLIDAHVHVIAATADLADLRNWAPSYVAYQASRAMSRMLDR